MLPRCFLTQDHDELVNTGIPSDSMDGAPKQRVYRAQQTHYLRIDEHRVLQMLLYLDPLHVDWMNDSILNRVLGALKLRIPPKLRKDKILAEQRKGSAKARSDIDVYRGREFPTEHPHKLSQLIRFLTTTIIDNYQVAFFFRSVPFHRVNLSLKTPLTFKLSRTDRPHKNTLYCSK